MSGHESEISAAEYFKPFQGGQAGCVGPCRPRGTRLRNPFATLNQYKTSTTALSLGRPRHGHGSRG
jgi:hypothetical protein